MFINVFVMFWYVVYIYMYIYTTTVYTLLVYFKLAVTFSGLGHTAEYT